MGDLLKMDDCDSDTRSMCKYGVDCYQRNPDHQKKYKHPKRKSSDSSGSENNKRNKPDKAFKNGSPGKSSPSDKIPMVGVEESSEGDMNKDVLELPSDLPTRIKSVFLAQMPDDFYSFFEFCKSLNEQNPHNALSVVGIKLVGPYDLIDKNLRNFSMNEGLRHYRYYYDPPEFLTVLSCNNKKLLHYGYFRDNPNDLPSFVASNEASEGCAIEIVGTNVFSALHHYVEKVKKNADPFKKIAIQKIQQKLSGWCTKNNYDIDTFAKANRERKSKIVTKTFHGAGIVVPYEKRTQLGYRELQENDKDLKKILCDICEAKSDDARQVVWAKLQPVITFANIANDEFDFGSGLELGIDLFCQGDPIFHKSILNILPTSYELLGRSDFVTIIRAHLENRIKGSELNTIVK